MDRHVDRAKIKNAWSMVANRKIRLSSVIVKN